MNQKVIIHARGVEPEIAVACVHDVMRLGRISADGQSYCYATTYPDIQVFTDKPRPGTHTYTFYVLKRES